MSLTPTAQTAPQPPPPQRALWRLRHAAHHRHVMPGGLIPPGCPEITSRRRSSRAEPSQKQQAAWPTTRRLLGRTIFDEAAGGCPGPRQVGRGLEVAREPDLPPQRRAQPSHLVGALPSW